MDPYSAIDDSPVDILHEIGSRMAAADSFQAVLARVVDFAIALVKCDSCFIYVLEGNELILRASKNPHEEIVGCLKLQLGQGITGWVAEHREPVAVHQNAFQDSRFQFFNELPEDRYEAFLSVPIMSRGGLVGVINLQHRQPHVYNKRQSGLSQLLDFWWARKLRWPVWSPKMPVLARQLEARKLVERAKGILQRDLGFTEEQAYLALQRQSRQKRRSMKEVAEAIVLSEEVKNSSKAAPPHAAQN